MVRLEMRLFLNQIFHDGLPDFLFFINISYQRPVIDLDQMIWAARDRADTPQCISTADDLAAVMKR
jgi:hypothetical protein